MYVGEWLNEKRDGKGTMTQVDGSKYEGDFVDDMCQGQGKLKYANGDSYMGEWFQDRKHTLCLRKSYLAYLQSSCYTYSE